MNTTLLLEVLGYIIIGIPLLLLIVIGLPGLFGIKISERQITQYMLSSVVFGTMVSFTILATMLIVNTRHVSIEIGNWVKVPDKHIHFVFKLVFDRLSIPFVILTYILVGTVGRYASSYLHKENGYHRFIILFTIFLQGMLITSTAGTIETLFTGWELVGLSSVLLVAFFHERLSPVKSGLHVWVVYRCADAALLMASIYLHHQHGAGDFDKLLLGDWPDTKTEMSATDCSIVGFLLLFAAAGKSALIPFCGWMPKAMEGPTASTAIFYGALSVHLGAFLMLRFSPLFEHSCILTYATIALGISTAFIASMISRVQTDIKSSIAYGSLTQLGVIMTEIGLGLRYLALIHIIGHACLRTLQFLRAPSVLQYYRSMENDIGGYVQHPSIIVQKRLPGSLQIFVYRFAMEQGYLDTILRMLFINPFNKFFTLCDRLERKWTDFLTGGSSRESDAVDTTSESLDQLL